MSNDDPLDDVRQVSATAGAAAARVVETIVREAQTKARERRQRESAEAREAALQDARREGWDRAHRDASGARDDEQKSPAPASEVKDAPVQPRPESGPEGSKSPMTEKQPADPVVLADQKEPAASGRVPDDGYSAATRADPARRETVNQALDWARRERPDLLEAYERLRTQEWSNGRGSSREGAEDYLVAVHTPAPVVYISDPWAERKPAEAADEVQSTGPSWDESRPARDQAMREAGVPEGARNARTKSDLLNGHDPQLAAQLGTKSGKARGSRDVPAPTRERTR